MTRPVFFTFESDDTHFPMQVSNESVLSKDETRKVPTVASFAKFIHSTFKTNVPLSFTFTVAIENTISMQSFNENSPQPIPVDNLENVVVVRRLQQDIHPAWENFKDACVWLSDGGIDEKSIKLLRENGTNPENMQYLTHSSLEKIGVTSWGKRSAIINSAKQFYDYFNIVIAQQQSSAAPTSKRIKEEQTAHQSEPVSTTQPTSSTIVPNANNTTTAANANVSNAATLQQLFLLQTLSLQDPSKIASLVQQQQFQQLLSQLQTHQNSTDDRKNESGEK